MPLKYQHKVKLDKNENRFGCSPLVIEKIVSILENKSIEIHDYFNNNDEDGLESDLYNYYADSDYYFHTYNGSISAINNIISYLIPKNCQIISFWPNYWVYQEIAKRHGIKYKKIPFLEKNEYDLEKLSDYSKTDFTRAIIIDSPNNPVGNIISIKSLVEMLDSINPEILFIIDEAYAEYAKISYAELIKNYENLIIIKTFSKAYGLAGLRIGYTISNEAIYSKINQNSIPYSVNILSQLAAKEALKDQQYLDYVVNETNKNREQLFSFLKNIHFFQPYNSNANYIFVKMDSSLYLKFKEIMWKKGIILRYFDDLGPFFRVTIGTDIEMKHLMKEIYEFKEIYNGYI